MDRVWIGCRILDRMWDRVMNNALDRVWNRKLHLVLGLVLERILDRGGGLGVGPDIGNAVPYPISSSILHAYPPS